MKKLLIFWKVLKRVVVRNYWVFDEISDDDGPILERDYF